MSNSFSREFLGDTPTKKNQLILFGVTIISVGIVGYKNFNELLNLPIWKSILFLLILLDIFAGAIGNFTKSTQTHYKNNRKKRIIFLFTHIVHIGLLILAVGHIWYASALLAFTIAEVY